MNSFVLLLFVLSGLTSLVYQVVWFRMFALVFGNTVLASSTVLSVFFLGLAIGSLVIGRYADRIERKVLFYGILEGSIGIYALIFPLILSAMSGTYISLYRSFGEGLSLNLIRAGISGLLLLLPTIFMGGTFPLIARYWIESMDKFRRGVSVLYFVNTSGAVIGTVLAGFLLIAQFGIRTTTAITATLNIFIFVMSIFVQPKSPAPAADKSDSNETTKAPLSTSTKFILWGTLLSGFTSITYEVVWMRAFTSYFGSSIYSFSSILTAFLVGIALGGLYFSRKYGRDYSALRAFGEIQLRVALSVVLFLVLFMKLPAFIVWGIKAVHTNYGQYQLLQFALVLIAMLYTTVNLGASFPAANAAYIQSMQNIGQSIGKVYAYNTLGSIAGAFLAGFILIPSIGMEKTIWLAFAVNLILGVVSLRIDQSMDRMAWIWTAASIALFLIVPRWDRNVLNYGIYASAYAIAGNKYSDISGPMPETFGKKILQQAKLTSDAPDDFPQPPPATSEDTQILYFKEGVTSTISVIQDSRGFKNLLINGKADASNNRTGDMRTQLLLGHLPLLLSRRLPPDALVIGLGSGTTLGSVEQYPLQRIDCVEIEPAVVEAARNHFAQENHNALQDPRVRLIIADGRNFLAATKNQYGTITSEPSNLWMAGCSNLFTREFFESARQHLRKGGIMCQWIHLYQISPNDIRIFLRTYHSVFPHILVWIDDPDMLVLGSEEPITIMPDLLIRRLAIPEIRAELYPSNLARIDQFLSVLAADSRMAERFAQGAPLNQDDHPILEFSAPKSILEIHSEEIIRELLNGVPYQN